jgi:hypothetical protein
MYVHLDRLHLASPRGCLGGAAIIRPWAEGLEPILDVKVTVSRNSYENNSHTKASKQSQQLIQLLLNLIRLPMHAVDQCQTLSKLPPFRSMGEARFHTLS